MKYYESGTIEGNRKLQNGKLEGTSKFFDESEN